MKTTTIPNLTLTGAVLLFGGHLSAQTSPNIEITNFPPFGAGGYLQGRASTDESNRCAVVVYIKVNEGWYNKPTYSNPLTTIDTNGSWSCNVATYAPSDVYATKYAAFLVPLSASNDVPILDGKSLPEELDEIALAKDFRIRTPLFVSGMEWEVKATVPEPLGMPIDPGPNRFSTNNASVDDIGRLHLKISKEIQDGTNKWTCAEIICGEDFRDGLYRFYVDSRVDDLDPSVVFSPFIYSDYTNYAHREIDIEFTTWNGTVTNGNAQYAIQQSTNPVIVEHFEVPSNVTNSVHSFAWAPWRIDFKSLKGHDPASTNAADLICDWSYTNASRIPPAGLVRPRINLYLSAGQPPTDSNEVEMIVSRFEYQPLLRVTGVSRSASNTMRFTIQQEVAGLFDLESCTNLGDAASWQKSETNISGVVGRPMQFEVSITNSKCFYRGNLRSP